MNNRTKLMTAAGGALLLAGVGGALALWSDNTTGDSLLASTGYLNVSIEEASTYVWDISKLCQPTATNGTTSGITWKDCSIGSTTPGPTPLVYDEDGIEVASGEALKAFKLVPGDEIRVVVPIDVDLSGQNIAAKLTASLGAVAYDGVDGSTTSVSADDQFQVTPRGIYGTYSEDNATNANAALTASASGTSTSNPTYYFQGKDDPTTVYAVIDIQFLDFDNGSTTITDGANDADGNNAADDEDLMEISALELISAINAQLVQVRS